MCCMLGFLPSTSIVNFIRNWAKPCPPLSWGENRIWSLANCAEGWVTFYSLLIPWLNPAAPIACRKHPPNTTQPAGKLWRPKTRQQSWEEQSERKLLRWDCQRMEKLQLLQWEPPSPGRVWADKEISILWGWRSPLGQLQGDREQCHGHHGAGNVMSSQSIRFASLLSVVLKKALLANRLHGKFISLLLTLCKTKRKIRKKDRQKVIIKRIQHKFPGGIRRSSLKIK